MDMMGLKTCIPFRPTIVNCIGYAGSRCKRNTSLQVYYFLRPDPDPEDPEFEEPLLLEGLELSLERLGAE